MNAVRLLPVFLSAVLPAAHLLREGLGVFAVVGLAFTAASALVFLFRPIQVRYKLAKPSTPKGAPP